MTGLYQRLKKDGLDMSNQLKIPWKIGGLENLGSIIYYYRLLGLFFFFCFHFFFII
jgi:hypothetical protein